MVGESLSKRLSRVLTFAPLTRWLPASWAAPSPSGCHAPLDCLVDLAGGVLENDIGEHDSIGLVRQVRAEADADVEGPVEAQVDGWAELVHRFAFEADEEREGGAVLFDADALGHNVDEAVRTGAAGTAAAPDAILHVGDADALPRTLGKVDHAETVEGGDGLLGIVIEVLANDEDCLAVAVAVRVGVRDVGRE